MKNIIYLTGLKVIVKGLMVWSMMLYKNVKDVALAEEDIVDNAWSCKKLKTIDKVDNLITWRIYKLLGEEVISADNKRILRKQLRVVNLYLGHTQDILYTK